MTTPARPRQDTRARWVALLLCTLVLLSHVLWSLPASADTDPSGSVDVQLTSMTPEVIRPGDVVTVVATITNHTATTIQSPVATLAVEQVRYSTRDSLAAWTALTPADKIGKVIQSTPLAAPLAPGESAPVTFTFDADAMNLRTGTEWWGPRGMAVAVGESGDTVPRGVLRSYLLWFPVADEDVLPVDVSVVVPIVGPVVDPLDLDGTATTLEEALTSSGRLSTVLQSTESTSAVAWAVDPTLVTDASATAAVDPVVSQKAATFAKRLLAGATGRQVFALPDYDQDWSAHAAARQPRPSSAELPPAISGWRTDLAWPEEPTPAVQSLELAAGSGAPLVLVAPGTMAPDPALTYTPTGRATVETAAGTVTALVPDAVLSGQLAAPVETTAAGVRQRLLAELAVIAVERPAEARHVLMTVPRSWSPSPTLAQAQLTALGTDAPPWVRLSPVSTLIGAADPAIPRTPPGDLAVDGMMTAPEFEALNQASAAARTFAQVVPDPTALTDPIDAAIRAAGSIEWRTDPAGRTAAIDEVEAKVDSLRQSIGLVDGSSFNLIASGSDIPIQLTNSLDQDATVKVELAPDDTRLVAKEKVTVTIPAGGETYVRIPVEAVGSGNVTVGVRIMTVDDAIIADPAYFEVRVRANWENFGTAAAAALLLLLLGGGIWRTIRRGRSDRRVSVEEVALLEQTDAMLAQPGGTTQTDGQRSTDTSGSPV